MYCLFPIGTENPHVTALAESIKAEIRERGVLSFARFMERALYAPGQGYYERGRGAVGRAGDFYTSVSTGPLFGELLAFQFAAWLAELPAAGGKRALVEAGAHDGRLAADILGWLRRARPDLLAGLEYILVEPSDSRREWQGETLKDFAGLVRWVDSPAALQADPVTGIFFSNELLDAFPVRRYGWDAAGKQWFEWGVTVSAGELAWTKLPGAPRVRPAAELEAVLPDGYVVEDTPAAEAWWQSAAGALRQGKLLAIDYGLTAPEVYSPARVQGTLRSYSKHRSGTDLLADPGGQDLTAQVHFSAVQAAGEAAGLVTEAFTTQPRFLTRIMAATQGDVGFGAWDAARARQFQTLTHPEHLGRAFRVLVQKRGKV